MGFAADSVDPAMTAAVSQSTFTQGHAPTCPLICQKHFIQTDKTALHRCVLNVHLPRKGSQGKKKNLRYVIHVYTPQKIPFHQTYDAGPIHIY